MFCGGNHFLGRHIDRIKALKIINRSRYFCMFFLPVSETDRHLSGFFQSKLNICPVAPLFSAHQSPDFPLIRTKISLHFFYYGRLHLFLSHSGSVGKRNWF